MHVAMETGQQRQVQSTTWDKGMAAGRHWCYILIAFDVRRPAKDELFVRRLLNTSRHGYSDWMRAKLFNWEMTLTSFFFCEKLLYMINEIVLP
ncbi:hypothetical protein AVEN_257366-1 [Araneus ventricosus]|uniref:Uncharacterized protein n=1 Tax=Araneus ventricosus TaxID=182803 RepID=A0A4Y2CC18_ARAVE|nr:hypothetical protein AVEN_257366-1 [Araneus ventricosus]